MTPKPIPKSLLNLLAEPWQGGTNASGSTFECVFEDEDRARQPSFYFTYEASRSPSADMLQFSEVNALIRGGVFSPSLAAVFIAANGKRQTSTNEHAQHAIIDFCEAVYAAWHILQNRLDRAEKACPIHPRDRQ